MAKTLKFQVHNARAAGQYALMACDLAVGYEENGRFTGILDIRGLFLKERNDGSGRFVSFPSKARIKGGVHQEDDTGRKIYDNIADLYMEVGANPDKADKRAPTKAAWAFKDFLMGLMEEAYDAMGEAPAPAPRQPARPAATAAKGKATKPAGAQTKIQTPVVEDDEDTGGDDDLPF